MQDCVPWDKRLSLSGVHVRQVCNMRSYGDPTGRPGGLSASRCPCRRPLRPGLLLPFLSPRTSPVSLLVLSHRGRGCKHRPALVSDPQRPGCCRAGARWPSVPVPVPLCACHAPGPPALSPQTPALGHLSSPLLAPWLPTGHRRPPHRGVPLSPSPALRPPTPVWSSSSDSLCPWHSLSPVLVAFMRPLPCADRRESNSCRVLPG